MSLIKGQKARKPDLYPWAFKLQRSLQHSIWSDEEFTFQSDKQQFFTEMNEEQREIITRCLALIGQVEVAVKRFWAEVGKWYRHDSIASLGLVCAFTEVVHSQAYSRLLEVMEMDDKFNEILKEKVVSDRFEYLTKHTEKQFTETQKQRLYALILFTLFVENVSLFTQFYVINYFDRSFNWLKDTTTQISYTIHEEDLHAKFGISLINTLREENPELFDDELMKVIEKEVNDAYKHECRIVEWVLGEFDHSYEDGSGNSVLNVDAMKYFIAERLNSSMEEIGMPFQISIDKDYSKEVKWFNERHKLVKKTDTFAKTSTAYLKHGEDYDNEEL